VSGGLPSWAAPAAVSANTLDGAYDEGGAGAGRIITADAGAVVVSGTDGFVVSPTVLAHTDVFGGSMLTVQDTANGFREAHFRNSSTGGSQTMDVYLHTGNSRLLLRAGHNNTQVLGMVQTQMSIGAATGSLRIGVGAFAAGHPVYLMTPSTSHQWGFGTTEYLTLEADGALVHSSNVATTSHWALFRKDQNANTNVVVQNANTGASSRSRLECIADTEQLYMEAANGVGSFLIHNVGTTPLLIQTTDAAPILFGTSGAEVARFSPSGEILVGTSAQTDASSIAEFQKNQDEDTTVVVENTTAGTSSAAGNAYIGVSGTGRSFVTSPTFTTASGRVQNALNLEAGTGLSGGININAREAAPIIFKSSALEIGRFASTGEFLLGTTAAAGCFMRVRKDVSGEIFLCDENQHASGIVTRRIQAGASVFTDVKQTTTAFSITKSAGAGDVTISDSGTGNVRLSKGTNYLQVQNAGGVEMSAANGVATPLNALSDYDNNIAEYVFWNNASAASGTGARVYVRSANGGRLKLTHTNASYSSGVGLDAAQGTLSVDSSATGGLNLMTEGAHPVYVKVNQSAIAQFLGTGDSSLMLGADAVSAGLDSTELLRIRKTGLTADPTTLLKVDGTGTGEPAIVVQHDAGGVLKMSAYDGGGGGNDGTRIKQTFGINNMDIGTESNGPLRLLQGNVSMLRFPVGQGTPVFENHGVTTASPLKVTKTGRNGVVEIDNPGTKTGTQLTAGVQFTASVTPHAVGVLRADAYAAGGGFEEDHVHLLATVGDGLILGTTISATSIKLKINAAEEWRINSSGQLGNEGASIGRELDVRDDDLAPARFSRSSVDASVNVVQIRNDATAAAGRVAELNWQFLTSSGEAGYAEIQGETVTTTAGTEDGKMTLRTKDGGSFFDGIILEENKLGFFSTTPVAQPTGVAVSAAGIHAALVSLGLITA